MSQLAPNLAKILADSKAVRHGTESVLKILEEVLKLRWVVGVGDDSCKMFILFITDANNPDSVELIGDFTFAYFSVTLPISLFNVCQIFDRSKSE